MRRLLIALLAGMFLAVTPPVPARAEPITIAILGSIGISVAAGSVGAAIGTFVLTAAASYGLSLIANALKPKPAFQEPASGNDLNVQYGGDVPREVIVGTLATAGHLVYTNVYGTKNTLLQCVFVLSDGQCDGINRMWINGELVTLVPTGNPNEYVADELRSAAGVPLFFVRFFDGSYTQAADPVLVATANPPGRWTTNHRGRGVCYISITQEYFEDKQLVGIPSILVELRGNKLYDPRKDSTNGGSGAHRWGTPSTYEFSENPAVIEYNFRRGIRVNDQVLVGMDTVAAGDLIVPMYIAAANDCDDAIPLLAGGTEPRYRCGLAASADKQHSSTLDAIRQSMAGFSLERAGQFGPIAGVAQSSVFEFSDADFIVGAKATFSKYETRSNIATAVYGNFSDPTQKWAAVPFPARENLTDDALMGERLTKSLDLTQVSSSARAQRIAEIERRRSMMQAHASQTLGADFIGLQPGDWGTYHSPYGDMTVQVTSLSLAGNDEVTFSWRQIASSVFSWTTAGELDPPAVPTPGQPGTRVTSVAAFAAGPAQVTADSGLTLPAIQCTWTPILDPTIARIDIEYRVVASPATVLTFTVDTPSTGIAVISGSVQANTAYELRAMPVARPDRTTTWTSWVPATSGSNQVVLNSLAAASATFQSQLAELVSQALGSGFADLQDDVEQLRRAISETRTRLYWNVNEVKTVIEAREGALSASIEDVRTVAVNADTAIASLSTTLTATFGTDFFAAVKFELGALVKADGTTIAMGGLTLNAQNKIVGYQIYNDGTSGNFDIETDFFRVGKSGVTGGTFVPVFTVDTVNGTPKVALRGDMLIDGTILARHMTVNSIAVGTVIADNIIVRGKLVADTATRMDVAQNGSQTVNIVSPAELVSLPVTSIGGTFAIDASVDMSLIASAVGSVTAGNFIINVLVNIDGSTVKTIAVPAFVQNISGTNYDIAIIGHFAVKYSAVLAAGAHTIKIFMQRGSTGWTSVTVAAATIEALEARR